MGYHRHPWSTPVADDTPAGAPLRAYDRKPIPQEFPSEYRQARRAIVRVSLAAITVLEDILLHSENDLARVQAARLVLPHLLPPPPKEVKVDQTQRRFTAVALL